jgi:hypothetical protein
MDAQRAEEITSTRLLTAVLVRDGWLMRLSGFSTPGTETRYPLYMRLGGTQGLFVWVRKTSHQGF